MRRIRKYIACALSAAMVMSSAFVQGAVVSHAEEQDVGIVATAGDAEEADVEAEELDAQGEGVESVDTETGLKYKVTDDEITITGYSGTAAKVEIPSEIDGKSVTSIGDSAFECPTEGTTDKVISNGVTSVLIPSSVTSIGDKAFMDCISLSSVSIPDGVTSIGAGAFRGCISLTSVNIPNSVSSIGSDVLADCSSLASITVASGNKAYDSRDNCNAIIDADSKKLIAGCKNTVIPDGITSIGVGAFSGCTGLTSIKIPDGVTSIGYGAFEECTGLKSVSMPDGLISIEGEAFLGCSSLTSITIPDSVTSIEYYAFMGCSSATSINIPDSLTSIGFETFAGCSALTSLTIPKGVTNIDTQAFDSCGGLTSIVVEEGNTVYNSANGCNAIIETASNELILGCRNTVIPNGVTHISRAFLDCQDLTSIIIPSSVTSIDDIAFSGCSSLTSLYIPDTVTSIGEEAFEGCPNLTIICNKDSAAYKYAVDNEIPLKVIGTDGALATGVKLNQSAITLETGKSSTLTATVTPDNAISDVVIWKSSDSKVATVDSTGKVTAVSAGTAAITCTAIAGSGVTASCTVTVTEKASSSIVVTNIKLNETTKTLAKGKSVTLKATVTPSNATNTGVTWKSSKTSVATVSNGVVKAVGVGTATITCTVADGSGKSATCTITVTTPVTGVKLDAKTKTIAKGKSVTLKATVSPADATDKAVTWKSSNTKVATVSSNGKVTAKKVGTATITCTTKDGKKTYTCKITVKTPVTKVKLSKNKATLKKGKSLKLKATVTPSKAYQKVTWKSSNTKVATVSSSGKVTAKKKGTATITCTAADGSGKKVTCKITVK